MKIKLAIMLLLVFASAVILYTSQSKVDSPEVTSNNQNPSNKTNIVNEQPKAAGLSYSAPSQTANPMSTAIGQISPAATNSTGAQMPHQCGSCSTFPARHPKENRELTPVEKYSMVHNFFPPNITVADLPDGHFKVALQALAEPVQQKVLKQLVEDKTPTINLESLHVSEEGALLFACPAPSEAENKLQAQIAAAESTLHPAVGASAVPISSPPARSSRPGSSNVLYIDFNGHVVTNTAWGTTTWNCLPFDTDGDPTTFSPEEQSAIIRIWEQVSEDYAHFNINVTTVEPATFTTRTARALVTRATDSNGVNLPFNTGGGVAYINVFSSSLYARYSPAFIYYNRLSNVASHIADAVTHEIGHNLGLYHDGVVAQGSMPALEYYSGHGTDSYSWGTIMGSPYWKNFSQWSKGEYFRANNTEDDLSKIGFKLGFRPDVEGSTLAQAEEYASPRSGVIDNNTDTDIWFVQTHSSLTVSLSTINLGSGGSRGGNLLASIDVFNEAGNLIESINQTNSSSVSRTLQVPSGKYFVQVRNQSIGSPLSSTPSGFTIYGSLGQYSLTVEANQYVANPLDHYLQWGQTNLNASYTDPLVRMNPEPLSNFERYAYNIPQGSSNPEAKMPKTGMSGNFPTVTFRVGQPNNVTYQVLESTDLQNWTEVNVESNTISSVAESDGVAKITVKSSNTILPTFFKVALRIK